MYEEYLFLVGPFLYWSYKTFNEYGEFAFGEIRKRKLIFIMGVALLVAHLVMLLVNGKYWFCSSGLRGGGVQMAFLFPGLGYAKLCYPFAINGSAFSTNMAKVSETALTILGVVFIAAGFFYILTHRLAVS